MIKTKNAQRSVRCARSLTFVLIVTLLSLTSTLRVPNFGKNRVGSSLVTGVVRSKSPELSTRSQATNWNTIKVYVGPRNEQNDSWRSFSQVQQDEVIRTLFPDTRGYFVDLAANHYSTLSNTYALETYDGWDGICVEPNEMYWPGYINRRCTLIAAVVGESDENVTFKKSNGEFGGVISPQFDNSAGEGVSHYTVTIREILYMQRAPKTIHYFSLDVEGAESIVFAHIPFDAYTIYSMTIERPRQDVLKSLSQYGFVEVGILGDFGDTMYLSRRTPQFLSRLKAAQIKVTQLTKERYKDHLMKEELRMEIGSFRVNDVTVGVRCPYTKINDCELQNWLETS
jgi:hypothetical protein